VPQRTNGMSIFNHNIYDNIRTRVIVGIFA